MTAAETLALMVPDTSAARDQQTIGKGNQTHVFVSGCYDIIHGGHVQFWTEAKALGTHLTVSIASDASLAIHKKGRKSSIPIEHKVRLIESMRMVDRVVVGDCNQPGLDFEQHFLTLKPDLLVVTEDDRFGDMKRQLCAKVGAQYVVLPKTLGFEPISTTEILANIRTPSRCPLRVDFGGAWLDVPKHARVGSFIVNCTITPMVSLDDWPFQLGGGLGGSGAYALLTGRDSVQSELDLGVGWQDPAVIQETGLCVWRSGALPVLDFKVPGDFLAGKMALLWTGKAHSTPDNTDIPRDYDLIEKAGALAREAVIPGQTDADRLSKLAAAVQVSYEVQMREGMQALPQHGELARKYCGGGWGGYALYLFGRELQREAFLQLPDTCSIEPYIS